MKNKPKIALAICLAVTASTASALELKPDAIAVSYGKYTETFRSDLPANLENTRLSVRWNWDKNWQLSENWNAGGYFDLGYSQWRSRLSRSDNPSDGAEKVWQVGFSPVLRLNYQMNSLVTPFIDLGAGVSYQSKKDIQKEKPTDLNMGTHFQFELRGMAGLQFDTSLPFEVSAGFMHYSNADLNSDNEGADFFIVNVAFPL